MSGKVIHRMQHEVFLACFLFVLLFGCRGIPLKERNRSVLPNLIWQRVPLCGVANTFTPQRDIQSWHTFTLNHCNNHEWQAFFNQVNLFSKSFLTVICLNASELVFLPHTYFIIAGRIYFNKCSYFQIYSITNICFTSSLRSCISSDSFLCTLQY